MELATNSNSYLYDFSKIIVVLYLLLMLLQDYGYTIASNNKFFLQLNLISSIFICENIPIIVYLLNVNENKINAFFLLKSYVSK